MPSEIADRAIDARDEDAICLTEVIIACHRKEIILQNSDIAN